MRVKSVSKICFTTFKEYHNENTEKPGGNTRKKITSPQLLFSALKISRRSLFNCCHFRHLDLLAKWQKKLQSSEEWMEGSNSYKFKKSSVTYFYERLRIFTQCFSCINQIQGIPFKHARTRENIEVFFSCETYILGMSGIGSLWFEYAKISYDTFCGWTFHEITHNEYELMCSLFIATI